MRHIISRRSFLALAGSALAMPPLLAGEEPVPSLLDHIILGCSDLDRGIDFVAQHTGVRAAFGGVHPGRGTQNALLSLGERRYLEIMAPDPVQPDAKDPLGLYLKKLSEPRLVHWAIHPGDLGSFAKRLRDAGVVFEGPTPGSRRRPDGRVLNWKTINLADDRDGKLPFFIEWSADSVHPSVDAPSGCRLLRFEALSPDPEKLTEEAVMLGLDMHIVRDERAQLRATFSSAKGELTITS